MRRPPRKLFAQIAPDHPFDEFRLWQLAGWRGPDPLAVTQHGNAVGDALDFFQLVGDVDDAAAAILQ